MFLSYLGYAIDSPFTSKFALSYITKYCDDKIGKTLWNYIENKLTLYKVVDVSKEICSLICNLLPGFRFKYDEDETISSLIIHLAVISWVSGGILALFKSSLAVEYKQTSLEEESESEIDKESNGACSTSDLEESSSNKVSPGVLENEDGDGREHLPISSVTSIPDKNSSYSNNVTRKSEAPNTVNDEDSSHPIVILESPILSLIGVNMLKQAHRLLHKNVRALRRGYVNDEVEKTRVTHSISSTGYIKDSSVSKTVKKEFFAPFPTTIPLSSVLMLLTLGVELQKLNKNGLLSILRDSEITEEPKNIDTVSFHIDAAKDLVKRYKYVRHITVSPFMQDFNSGYIDDNELIDRFTGMDISQELMVKMSGGKRYKFIYNTRAAFEWSLFSPFCPVGALVECTDGVNGDSPQQICVGVPRNCLAPFAPGVVIPWCI